MIKKNKYYLLHSRPEVLSIEASAGTGKTHSLSLRYLYILKEEKEPSKILAVTFTNKAANEMKERLIRALKKIALGEKDIEEDLRDLKRQEAEELLEKILYNFHNFHVKTIDSFVSSLGRSYSFMLSLSPELEISFDESFYISTALKNLMEKITPSSEEGLIFKEYFENVFYSKKNLSWDLFNTIKKNIQSLMNIENRLGKELRFEGDKKKIEKLEKDIKDLINKIGSQNFFKNIEDIFSDKKKIYNFKIKFRDAFKDDSRKKFLENKYEEYLKEFFKWRNIPNKKIFKLLKEDFLKSLESENKITLNLLYRILIENLKNKSIFTDKIIYLGEEIRNYLIDEFQDTSRIQWDTFQPLIENCLSQGGTLFYVGDKKQAIYGWRGGDYKLFDEVSFISSKKNTRKIYLNKNYRCRKNILDFVKEVFDENNLDKIEKNDKKGETSLILKDVKDHFKIVKESLPEKEGGYVYYDYFRGESIENLQNECLKNLKSTLKDEILKAYRPDEIAILVRSNNEAMKILNFLLENDIPAVSPTALWLFSCKRINEIYNFIKSIEDPEDDLSFSLFLLSEIFQKKSNTQKDEWLKFLFENKDNKKIFYNFKNNYEELYKNLIKEFLYSFEILSAYELVNKIINEFDLIKNFPEDEAFFYGFLEWILNLQTKGVYSLRELIYEIENLEEKNSEDAKLVLDPNLSQIKVMTIHKAKGLGFPVVILPLLKMPKYQSELYFKIENDLAIPISLKKDYVNKSEEFLKIYQNFYTKYIIEELNTIYVALTRAQDALIVFELENNYGSIISPFPQEKFELGSIKKGFQPKKEEREEKLYFSYQKWKDRLVKEKIDINIFTDFERLKKIEEGIKKHKNLQKGIYGEIPKEFKNIIEPKDYLSKEWEIEMVNDEGEVFRSDLLFEFKDKVYVIDFKFGERKEEDFKQVKNYKKILENIYKKPVEGFILYFQEEKIQKV